MNKNMFITKRYAVGKCRVYVDIEEEFAQTVLAAVPQCLRTDVYVAEGPFREVMKSRNVPDEVIERCLKTFNIEDETYLVASENLR
jgi:hypothetical protein